MSPRPVSDQGFATTSDASPGAIAVKLSGSCDSQSMASLNEFLTQLHAEAVRNSAKKVTLDCESLYFMNSASIKCFVMWLTKVKALPPSHRYHVVVRLNRFLAWQQRSFGSIARSTPEVVTIESVASPA